MDAQTAIIEAFHICFESKPLETISVAEICAAAHVSKKTFYNHFPTKQSIVSAVIERDFFAPQREMRKALFASQLRSGAPIMLGLTFETMLRKRAFYEKLVREITPETFVGIFSRQSEQLNREAYLPTKPLSDEEQADLDYMCMFLATISGQTLMWWLKRGFDLPPERVAALYQQWAFGHIHSQDTPYPEMCDASARSR